MADSLLKITKNRSNVARYFGRFVLNTPPVMVQTSQSICESLLGVEPREPNHRDLTKVYDRLLEAYKKKGDLYSVSRKDIRLAPWLMFSVVHNLKPLSSFDGFLRSYLQILKEKGDSRAIQSLGHVILWKYPCQEIFFKNLIEKFNQLVEGLTGASGERFRQKCKEYNLFLVSGPDTISKVLIRNGESLDIVFKKMGLSGACLKEGIIEYAFLKWLQRIKVGLTQYTFPQIKKPLKEVMAFAIVESFFRFPNQKKYIPESLLLPFLHKKAEIEIKDLLVPFFVKHFGDPRVDQAGWVGVSDDAKQVLRSWLVEDTMEDFFRLLDYVAEHHYETDIDRMWKYRKAFWAAYLKNGLIDDAWVALGSSVTPDAHRFIGQKKNQYASLYGGQSSHSILVMRMQDLIIVEWSHSGKCRFWHDSNKAKPELYRRYYDRSDVVHHADEEISHHGAENYSWQSNAANYIRRQIGASVRLKEYTV